MKIGVYFDLRVPPGSGLNPARVYAHTLEMCQEAEELGADSLWFSEHHLFDDGYLPQPLTMAAAAAARTSRVRLGTALIVAPLHNQVDLAEQAAVVDLISNGRLDLGLGAGYRVPEFELYGKNRGERFAATAATVGELRRLWGDEGVTPRPVQRPIPIWLGHGGPVGARRAGRLGAEMLLINPALMEPYRQGRIEGGHDPETGRMSGPVFAYPSDDPEREWPEIAPYISYQQNSYRRHMALGLNGPTPRPFDADAARKRDPSSPGSYWFDTPEAIVARLAEWLGDTEIDTMFFWASVGGMPESLVERNVRMICGRLAPLLRTTFGADTRVGQVR
ncbi:LLM class flavin-dependent oxidoreductase [Specibacter sp. RAF43]|uniref:LLM class flavin-dependent oxidoreductase n=1 Tax=Specibacter sp. RAF43 TaxID=3233057 RepID=UPI003F9C2122